MQQVQAGTHPPLTSSSPIDVESQLKPPPVSSIALPLDPPASGATSGPPKATTTTTLPHPRIRWILFLVLVFNASLVESFSYAYLGHVFSAYQTGTLIILGLSLTQYEHSQALSAAFSFSAFCIGSFVAGLAEHLSCNPSPFRVLQLQVVLQLISLIPATILSGLLDVSAVQVQYVCVVLTALAMSFQMAAAVGLKVKFLPMPLSTGITHSLFAQTPWVKGDRQDVSSKQVSQIVVLLLGAVVGGLIGYYRSPWQVLLFACLVVVLVIVILEVVRRWKKREESIS